MPNARLLLPSYAPLKCADGSAGDVSHCISFCAAVAQSLANPKITVQLNLIIDVNDPLVPYHVVLNASQRLGEALSGSVFKSAVVCSNHSRD